MMTEIRWHGRGGQGAKTVSQLLAMAIMDYGLYVQAFPEYGPERSGAPMKAYTRSSNKPIRLHCGVTNPGVVAVLDASLLGEIDITEGLIPGGIILINTGDDESTVRNKTGFDGTLKLIDADHLARESGIGYANVVMAGALSAVTETPPLESLLRATTNLMGKKLNAGLLEKNITAIKAGYHAMANELNTENKEATWLLN